MGWTNFDQRSGSTFLCYSHDILKRSDVSHSYSLDFKVHLWLLLHMPCIDVWYITYIGFFRWERKITFVLERKIHQGDRKCQMLISLAVFGRKFPLMYDIYDRLLGMFQCILWEWENFNYMFGCDFSEIQNYAKHWKESYL